MPPTSKSSANRDRRILSGNRVAILFLLLSVVLVGLPLILTGRADALEPQQNPSESARLREAYDAAIYDSAVYKFSNVRPLKPLTFDPATKKATVVTLTDYPYKEGSTTLPIYLWVTQVPEVQQICQHPSGDLKLSLQQLLGLPTSAKFTHFVVMTVTEGHIFRPATNPDPKTTLPCSAPAPANCGQQFPKFISDTYVNWFTNQALNTWAVSEPAQPTVGYPWTRLGYTYNWKPGTDKYGASEYVIEPGSSVTVMDIIPYKTYCSPKP